MSRLIDADRLREDILDLQNCYNGFSDTYDKTCIIGVIDEQPTIDHAYGFPLEHLAFIARVMEKEGITPGEVAGLLRDAGKISEMVADVVQKVHRKFIREAVRRVDDDPSHPFADGVMMKE